MLDRLTDLDPGPAGAKALDQQSLTMAQLRKAVLRDLGWLLNATNLDAVDPLPEGSLAARSTLNFGIPSIAGTDATGRPASHSLARRLTEDAIRAYEPRIRPDTP